MKPQKIFKRIGEWHALGLIAAGTLTLAVGFATGLTRYNATLLTGLILILAGAAFYLAALRR